MENLFDDISVQVLFFGSRRGHIKKLREHAIKVLKLSDKEVATLTDYEIKEKFFEKDYVPVVIAVEAGYNPDENETVFLVKKEMLENQSLLLSR